MTIKALAILPLTEAEIAAWTHELEAGNYVPRPVLRRLLVTAAQLYHDRYLLARLAADTPQFDNPLDAWGARDLRDRVLAASHPGPSDG